MLLNPEPNMVRQPALAIVVNVLPSGAIEQGDASETSRLMADASLDPSRYSFD